MPLVQLSTDVALGVAISSRNAWGDHAAGDIVMRVLPPLTIEESHVREFVGTLSAAAAARSAS